MIGWLLATAGTALLGSVFPLANIELYLVGVLSTVENLNWWALGLAAAVGQMTGKTLFFLAGRGGFSLGRRLGRLTEAREGGRWANLLERFHSRTEQHPWWGLGVLFISAVLSFPPFTVLCFLSGAAGLPLLGFLGVSLLGRAIHFLIVAGAPEVVTHLPFFG